MCIFALKCDYSSMCVPHVYFSKKKKSRIKKWAINIILMDPSSLTYN